MINIELVRQNPEQVRKDLGRKGEDPKVVDVLIELDKKWREANQALDHLRERRNVASKEIAELIRQGESASEAKESTREIGNRIKEAEESLRECNEELKQLILAVPNLPLPDVPNGNSEEDNIVVRLENSFKETRESLRPHWELSELLGIVDMERGAKLSGSRFYVFTDLGIRLQRALVNLMIDVHRNEHGYKEFHLPLLVKSNIMEGAGNLPKFHENLYHDDEDDLWLIPTAEVPLTGLHRDEILDSKSLPKLYMAHSPCFRREKAAAGRDTRGIKRVHQFDKVEMYQITAPENSTEALNALVSHAEEICKRLELPYRILELCTSDLGFQSAKSFDIEIWGPGSKEWLEVSSCSNCLDFQSRRSNIRFKRESSSKTEFVHTLNGSGLALPRVIIAIIENYQQEDGSVVVPSALIPYMNQELLLPVK